MILDPLFLHRYLYAYANPTVWIDPDGRAVVEEQIRTPEEYIKELRQLESKMLKEKRKKDPKSRITAKEVLDAELKRRKSGVTRKKGGRISDNRFISIEGAPLDMKHYLKLTELGKEHGSVKAKIGAYGEELDQGTEKQPGARISSLSPEDMPSNKMGADFGDDYYDPDAPSLADQIEKDFERLKKDEKIKEYYDEALPKENTKEWKEKFDYDERLKRPAPKQTDIQDFGPIDQYITKKVREKKKKDPDRSLRPWPKPKVEQLKGWFNGLKNQKNKINNKKGNSP